MTSIAKPKKSLRRVSDLGPEKQNNQKAITNAQKPKKDPIERAMELLQEYDEGTPPYQPGVDHWGE